MKINSNNININNVKISSTTNIKKQEKTTKTDKKKINKKSSFVFLPIEGDINIENNINNSKYEEVQEFFENFIDEEIKKIKKIKKIKPIIHEIKKEENKEENKKIIIESSKFDEDRDEKIDNENFNWLDIQNDG